MKRIFFIGLFITLNTLGLIVYSQNISYSFIVAGHAYGSHDGTNLGLHPPFLESLNKGFDTTVQFFVFAGDIVNQSSQESWEQVAVEMDKYNLPYYYVMGNHDNNEVGYQIFNEKHGNHYYSFYYGTDQFIMLNSTQDDRTISDEQLDFLENELSKERWVDHVFVFFHEVLWNSHEKYKGVKSNSRSRYDKIKNLSNYWTEVHPLLERYNDREIYVISGDVAGNTDAIPAFYDNWDHITLLSTGMGEVAHENYMQIDILDDKLVNINLIPLRVAEVTESIKWYSVPQITGNITGSIQNIEPGVSYNYSNAPVFNADNYLWTIPDNSTGSSTSHEIDLVFDNNFTSGELSVVAQKEGFGVSNGVSLFISATGLEQHEFNAVNIYTDYKRKTISLKNQVAGKLHIEIFDLLGKRILIQEIEVIENQVVEINDLKLIPFKGIMRISIHNRQLIFKF